MFEIEVDINNMLGKRCEWDDRFADAIVKKRIDTWKLWEFLIFKRLNSEDERQNVRRQLSKKCILNKRAIRFVRT